MKKIKITAKLAQEIIPKRLVKNHKYTFGKLLVWSGSLQFWGAPQLVSKAAYRAGVGLVTLACPSQLIPPIATACPETTFLPLSIAPNGAFLPNTASRLLQEIINKKFQACAIGPGLGLSNFSSRLIYELLQKISVPTVIDADAINALAQQKNFKQLLNQPPTKILTPHEGEFSRLINIETRVITERRAELAFEFALEHSCILILKGYKTLITDGKKIYENTTGSINLATAGTGDVLTGLLGALLAQGITPLQASILAVYIHGAAGDWWQKNNTDRGMLASEISNSIPHIYKQLVA